MFSTDKRNKSGLRGQCKKCLKASNEKYYEANSIKIKIACKEYSKTHDYVEYRKKYNETNKTKLKEKRKIFNKINRIKIARYAKEHYVYNPEIAKARSKLYTLNNPEKCKARHIKWLALNKGHSKVYYENNKEKILKNAKIYYELNKEKILKYNKNYRIDNKLLIAARNKKCQQKNRESVRIKIQRYRAKKHNLLRTLTLIQWEGIKNYFNNKCCYCGKELPLEQEHFIPVTMNGEYTLNNIIPACKSCNCSKSNKPFSLWYKNHKSYSKKREKIILEFLGYDDVAQQLKII